MNKFEIIKKIAEERFIENSLDKICFSPYKDDLAQDLYVDLLNKNSDLIEGLYNRDELKYYIIRMISLQVNSKTSPYYTKYEKFRKITDNIDETKRM